MNKLLKIIIGLILLVIPLYLIFPGKILNSWGVASLNLIKGSAIIFILLAGIILIIIGINDLRE